jgi:hypothetical protein
MPSVASNPPSLTIRRKRYRFKNLFAWKFKKEIRQRKTSGSFSVLFDNVQVRDVLFDEGHQCLHKRKLKNGKKL